MPRSANTRSAAPAVAVTATTTLIGDVLRVRLNDAYAQAIAQAGLVPLVVPPLDAAMAPSVLDAVQGLVLTGGEDVDPAEYGEARNPSTQAAHGARDKCEIALVRLARDRSVPTLAICRGIQVANVALGGTLVQDIRDCRPGAIAHDRARERAARVHDVTVVAGTRLAAAVGATSLRVNSSHHQSVERVADGLTVSASAPDGIVEGVEWTRDDWWMVGVQWHPEELVGAAEPWDRKLFAAFADAVRARLAITPPAASALRPAPGA